MFITYQEEDGKGSEPVNEGNSQPVTNGVKTFTQEDVDRIISNRLAEERRKVNERYADYEDLKKTVEKSRETLETLKAEREKALQEKRDLEQKTKRDAAIQKFKVDPELTLELLANREVEDYEKEIESLMERFPSIKQKPLTPETEETETEDKKTYTLSSRPVSFWQGGGLRINNKVT